MANLGTSLNMSANRTNMFLRFCTTNGWDWLPPITPCRTRWHGLKDAGVRFLQILPRVQAWHDHLEELPEGAYVPHHRRLNECIINEEEEAELRA